MGGLIATVLGKRHDAGYDALNPDAAAFGQLRALLGGSPTATMGDPAAFEAAMGSSPHLSPGSVGQADAEAVAAS